MNAFIANFHFLRPLWLVALAALPLVLWLWRRRAQRADPWRSICDPQLFEHLVQQAPGVRGAGVAPWLVAMGWLVAVLALAGPAWRELPQETLRLQAPLVVAVDLSDRMRASDLKPDRMSRVRFKLADLLTRRGEGQTALIGYAGDAFTVAPLTDDAASLSDLAASLSPEVMPLQGQRADRAIKLAQRLLRDAGEVRGDLLLITDTVDGRASSAARVAREAGLRVSVLGVGTEQGAPVPRAKGGFMQDGEGGILLPRLDAGALTALARIGGGHYTPLTVDDADLRQLGVTVAPLDAQARWDEEGSGQRAWRDEGPWLLVCLLPLAALVFRRGWLLALVLGVGLPAPQAQAAGWKDLWQRADQQAWEALEHGDAKDAQTLARDPALRGAAAYRSEDYPGAIDAYAATDGATGQYNLGNALAKAGRYQEAIAAYDQALAMQPDFPQASANRKAVQDWLEHQPPQSQSGDSDDGQGQQDSSSDSQQGQGRQKDEQQDPASDDTDPPQGEPDESQADDASEGEQKDDGQTDPAQDGEEESDADASQDGQDRQNYAEEMQQALEEGQEHGDEESRLAPLSTEEAERQQAMEHLLQRVPDDPGGLLRRKFQLELQRRQRDGDRR